MTNNSASQTASGDQHAAVVDSWFQEFNGPATPGASVVVIQDSQVVFTRAYGQADVENGNPTALNTNYRLASVTKQFTAMAVMLLAERGQLDFDDSILDYFPEFPAYGKLITVRQLLNHTSGLVDYEDIIPGGTVLPVLDINVLRLMQGVNDTYFPPGTRFRYSNTGYALLALITEMISGQTFASFLRRNIFQPLGMEGTLAYESGISTVSNRAYGYSPAGAGFARTDQSVTSSVLGDGGVYSSVQDFYQWDQALYGSKLVSPEMLAQAFTPGTATAHEDGMEYGFGWFLGAYRGLRNIWHSGNSIGFTTRIERFPEKHFTVIVLTNRNEAPLAEISRKIVNLFLFSENP